MACFLGKGETSAFVGIGNALPCCDGEVSFADAGAFPVPAKRMARRLALTPHFAEKALFASVPLASAIEGVLS